VAKVIDAVRDAAGRAVIVCDYTPPRGGDPALLENAGDLAAADFIAVAYNPGKLVRADSAAAAYALKQRQGTDVIFNLSPRDMNALALQSRLLGAQLLGLENVLVLQGDDLTERDGTAAVNEYTASGLIGAIAAMNQGTDLKGSNLRGPTDLCIGAALDLNRDLREEARLTARKVASGVHFLVSQPVFAASTAREFLEAYGEVAGSLLSVPVFWGLQVLRADGILFSTVPQATLDALEAGRDGVEIAGELYGDFIAAGLNGIYLISPILRGGARDYEAAGRVQKNVRA
jgi:homocysteine S-methyltransferase